MPEAEDILHSSFQSTATTVCVACFHHQMSAQSALCKFGIRDNYFSECHSLTRRCNGDVVCSMSERNRTSRNDLDELQTSRG
jgi:hypothetical protein